jgi:hypothetical protein
MTRKNTNLHNAKKAKNDEFYTLYSDVEAEVMNYKDYLKDKVVYLPCDSEESNFWKFFVDNFDALGVKKVIATHYSEDNNTYKLTLENNVVYKEAL